MKTPRIARLTALLPGIVLVAGAALPHTALAYIGPGAGLSVIGSLLAFLVAIVAAAFGFVWFPVRRLLKRRKAGAAAAARNSDAAEARRAAARESEDRAREPLHTGKPVHRGSGA